MAKKQDPKQLAIWQNRIVESGSRPASAYFAHDLNARRHPPAQRRTLRGALDTIGWVAPVIVSLRTDKTLDGHARIEEALAKSDDEPVPYVKVDVTEEEERLILATFDPITGMAAYDQDRLAQLLSGLQSESAALQSLLNELAIQHGADEDAGDDEPSDFTGVYELQEDVVFPSSNQWGLPDLRSDRLSSQVPTQTWDGGEVQAPETLLFVHGKAAVREEMKGGVYCFYIDDYKFESAWTDAVQFVKNWLAFGWGSVIATDFSVWRDSPLAIQLYNIYRNRWCARYWQEVGVSVIPSLSWSDERTHPFACAGIPEGTPVVACQVQTTGDTKGKRYFISGLTYCLKKIRPQSLILYGGKSHRAWIEQAMPTDLEVNYVWLDSWHSARQSRFTRKGKK